MSESRPDVRKLMNGQFGPFLRQKVAQAVAASYESHEPVPKATYLEAVNLGMLRVGLPWEYSGLGLTPLEWGSALQCMAYLSMDVGFPLVLSNNVSIVSVLHQTGNKALAEAVTRGEAMASFAYTDVPERGTAKDSLPSAARQVSGGWELTGKKPLIVGGMWADWFMTYLPEAESGDLCAFLVNRSDPNVVVSPVKATSSRTAAFGSLTMQKTFVKSEYAIVTSDGMGQVQGYLNSRRPLIGMIYLGLAQAIFDHLMGALSVKIRYGRRLTDLINVQEHLGEIYTGLEISRCALQRSLEAYGAGVHDPIWDPLGTVAKYQIVKVCSRLAVLIFELLGTEGALSESGWERHARELLGGIAGGGAQDILRVDFGTFAVNDWERRRLDPTLLTWG